MEKGLPPEDRFVPGLATEGILFWKPAVAGVRPTLWETLAMEVEEGVLPAPGTGAILPAPPRC